MQGRKVFLPVLILLFTTTLSFGQTEVFKAVVNNLAFYKQKKELKYLSNAKNSVDSLITTHADSLNIEKNVYKAVVYSSILYIDSLNKLNQPLNFLTETTALTDRLSGDKKIYKFQAEMDYTKRCLANVYLRKGFANVHNLDYINAIQSFQKAQKYVPSFTQINAYIAYSNSKLGNLQAAAKYYKHVLEKDSTKAEYVETASNIFKSIGDTVKALEILQKGRRFFPNDKFLLLNEANIYNNRKDYKSLETLLVPLLDNYPNNNDIAFIAANCYDHLNQYDKAESLYLRSIELNSADYDPVFNLGLLYFKQGITKHTSGANQNLTMAEQWLGKANEISPNDAKCLQLLKLLYAQTGDQNQLNKVNSKLQLLTN